MIAVFAEVCVQKTFLGARRLSILYRSNLSVSAAC